MKLLILTLLVSMSVFLMVFDRNCDGSVLAFGIVFFIPMVIEMKLLIKKLT